MSFRTGHALCCCPGRRVPMLYYALVFLIVGLIAGALGIYGVASVASQIAWVLFVIAIVLFILHFLSCSVGPPTAWSIFLQGARCESPTRRVDPIVSPGGCVTSR